MNDTPPIHVTPAKCPECGYSYRALSDHNNHSPTCSRIDLDSARHYLRLNHEYSRRVDMWRQRDRERAMFWEGKFHVVRHENNKLRKENVALKLSATPAKELSDWRDMFAAFCGLALPEQHRVKLWPNNWHQDCAAVAHFIHTHSGEEHPPQP